MAKKTQRSSLNRGQSTRTTRPQKASRRGSKNARPGKALAPQPTTSSGNMLSRRFRVSRKTILIFLILVGLVALAVYKKNWFVAAMVNNKPVLNAELQDRMNKLYREQTLNQMINERVIFDEARKKNIVIADSEIDERVKGIESDVGGAENLDSLLSQQRQSRSDLRDQLRIQQTIEKLYGEEASPSAEEVAKYLTENKAQLQASDSAGQESEAIAALRQQKLSQIFNDKFQELRNNANIRIF